MIINRRKVIQSLCGAPFLAATGAQFALAANPIPAVIFLGGIDPSTSATRLISILEPIIAKGIPVGCIIKPSDSEGNTLSSNTELADLFRNLLKDYSGLIEPIIYLPNLDKSEPYFRMRQVSNARAAFLRAIGQSTEGGVSFETGLTIATDRPASIEDLMDEVRVGGFRNVLFMPTEPSPAKFQETWSGVLQFNGGDPIRGPLNNEVIESAYDLSSSNDQALFLHVSLDQNVGASDADALQAGSIIADTIFEKLSSGGLYPTLPSEMHFRTGNPYRRLIALRLEYSSGQGAAVTDFANALTDAGLPFTLSMPADSTARSAFLSDQCLALNNVSLSVEDIAKDLAEYAKDSICLAANNIDGITLQKFDNAGVVGLSMPQNPANAFAGMDQHGIFHTSDTYTIQSAQNLRSPTVIKRDLLNAIGLRKDAVVAISADAIQPPATRQAIVEALLEIRVQDLGVFVSLQEFRKAVAPTYQRFNLLKEAKRRKALTPLVPETLGPSDVAEFRKDAEIAWQYFDTYTNVRTGLTAGTVRQGTGTGSGYLYQTMWDTGTQILAQISAHMIGLIDDVEFADRTKRLLANLSTLNNNGLRLPQAIVSITGSGTGRGGYDVNDVGRLLIALHILENYDGDGYGISEIVANWDLAETVKNGRLNSVRSGRLIEIPDSNYINYVARGFGYWGIDVNSPYRVPDEYSAMDAQMYVIERASYFGPISAEPHVLEQVELGDTFATTTITDVLHTAQQIEYEKTGDLICVSENPLNRAPWFTYQGFQLGDETDPWRVETISEKAEYQTGEFKRATSMVSSKAAFLWAATRSDQYAHLLLTHVRENGRIDGFGFATGIFTATHRPTPGYSDINTNGIILQAIAYALRGRKPMLW